ncbi:MAG TPA: hypothetical protein VH678_19025 [Xanthobacteraceae bacterium]
MTMTRSESQWIDRVMHTISYLAFLESCNTLAGTLENGPTDDVVRAAQAFIRKLQRENAIAGDTQLPGMQ